MIDILRNWGGNDYKIVFTCMKFSNNIFFEKQNCF